MLRKNRKKTPYEDPLDQSPDTDPLSSNQEFSNFHDSADNDKNRKIGKWTQDEDELLRKYVPLFGEKQWRKISVHIPGRTSIQCLHRWTKILKPGLVKGPWTAEEDQKLITWVQTEGPTKWAQCANFINGRSGKQCRERWFNNLNPNVKKGNWAKEEDELIFELYKRYGSSWSKIAKYIPGRTENAIKNRFYSTLRKLASDKRKLKDESRDDHSAADDATDLDFQGDDNLAYPQAPNALYKLLQEQVVSTQDKEDVKIEIPLEHFHETPPSHAKFDGKTQPTLMGSHEKLRHEQVEDKSGQEPSRPLHAEVDENDSGFEEFLVSLDNNLPANFLTKEFDARDPLDDVDQLEGLQSKILSFCQNNIQDLADAFKLVSKPKQQQPQQQFDYLINQFPSSMGMNYPQQFQAGLRGTTILTPSAIAQKDLTFKPQLGGPVGLGGMHMAPNQMNPFSFYHPFSNPNFGMRKLPSQQDSENSSDHEQQRFGLPELGQEFRLPQNMLFEKMMPQQSLSHHMAALSNNQSGSKTINFNDIVQRLPVNMEETEKRMTFLFQQLFSLETLLAKTRNNLVQFESTSNRNERRNSNQENLKIEELSNEVVNERKKQSMMSMITKQRSLDRLSSEFEQIYKKTKIETINMKESTY